ncbi:MAG: hypothetical protein EOO61_22105 [Hymenobacter sp.]|nr:MAG: hypothetical protein EOO61_22105 [Hymenobacter sp.]
MHTYGRFARQQTSLACLFFFVIACASCHNQQEIEKEKALTFFRPESFIFANVQFERLSDSCPSCPRGTVGVLLLSGNADTCVAGVREESSSLQLKLFALDKASNTYQLQDGEYSIGQTNSSGTESDFSLIVEGEYVFCEGLDARETIGTSDSATGYVKIVGSDSDAPLITYRIRMPDGTMFYGGRVFNRCTRYESEIHGRFNSPTRQPG